MDDRAKPPLNNNKPITALNVISGNARKTEEIDLNELWQSSLKKQVAVGKVLSIHRSDRLPCTNGNRESLTLLFDSIMFMILSHPPQNSKLFLYVRCKPDNADPEIMDLRVGAHEQMHQIGFYTNITTDHQWEQLYKDQLSACNVIAREHNGSFSFHPISNTGCLFSLTLSGKNC